MDILTGQIDKITYSNEENSYTVAKVEVDGEKHLVTVVGKLFGVSVGEMLKLSGEWTTHKKFGRQFKVDSFQTITPNTISGIEKYLGSGLIKGVGPKTAQRIVNHFKLDTLDVIEMHPQRLCEIEGIGKSTCDKIKTAWQEQRDIKDVMIFLHSYNISANYAVKIYNTYGKDAIRVVKENPYKLSTDIYGIGFKTADKIGASLGIKKDSVFRAEAGVIYTLREFASKGNTFVYEKDIVNYCETELDIKQGQCEKAIEILIEKDKVFKDVYDSKNVIYLKPLYIAEKNSAEKLKKLAVNVKLNFSADISKEIKKIEENENIVLNDEQKKAVEKAVNEKVLVITGGPGTGKTTIINTIIKMFNADKYKIELCAPTGRAAKRLNETTGKEARTIHRLLEYNPITRNFEKNKENPLRCNMLIVDEASMIDITLFNSLLNAVPDKCTLILLGDIDQLPSVGPGNVLKDVINSQTISVIKLEKIYRQSGKSSIIINAHKINHGEIPYINNEKNTDFYFIECNDPEHVVGITIELCKNRIPDKFGFDPFNGIQVLSPMNNGIAGINNLNVQLQNALNPSNEHLVRGSKTFKTGDKVMQTRNNYDKDVFNGDIGKITRIDPIEQLITVNFDGKDVLYEFTHLDDLVLAYAISIHKSQGSEYPAIIVPVLTQHYIMLQRNLIYTAVTRGKKLVNLIGTKKALRIAINNDKIAKRNSLLDERLKID